MKKQEQIESKEVNKKTKNNGKKHSMWRMIGISFLISFLIVIVYLGIETICVKTGSNMPFQKVVSGGDCMEYRGVFWGVTIVVPETSRDHPVPSAQYEYFLLHRFLLVSAGIAFLIWSILCIFQGGWKILLIVVGSAAAICLVFVGGKKIKSAWDEMPTEISSIMVITSDIHQGNYFSLRYPYDASFLMAPGEDGKYGKTGYEKMGNMIKKEDVTRKQLKALLQAAKEVKANTDTDRKKDFTYFIKVVYKTNKGYGQMQTTGYGEFPKEWAAFVHLTNEICGKDYLREEPSPVVLSPKWYSKTYGIYDKDLPEGASVEDFLSSRKINMTYICGKDSSGNYRHYDPEKAIEDYIASWE